MIFYHFWRFFASFEAFASKEIHRMPVMVTAIVDLNLQGTGLRTWINLKPSEIGKLHQYRHGLLSPSYLSMRHKRVCPSVITRFFRIRENVRYDALKDKRDKVTHVYIGGVFLSLKVLN